MNLISCRETKNAEMFSEFNENGYNRSSFCSFVRNSLYDKDLQNHNDTEYFAEIVNSLNKFFNDIETEGKNNSFSWTKHIGETEGNLSPDNQDISNLDLSDTNPDKKNTIDIDAEFEKIRSELKRLSEIKKYDDEIVADYLNSFLELSRKIVFNPGNFNLNSMLFRRSKTVENLNTLGRSLFDDSDLQKKGYSYFTVYSPYVCDAVMRIIHNMVEHRKRLFVASDNYMLQDLRKEIFVKQSERAFTRFTSYNYETSYRATLNRHNGEIISVPYNQLSSIEDIKPLRLFEKIAVFIRKEIEKLKLKNTNEVFRDYPKQLKINILIIGHTEMSVDNKNGSFDEREMCDLLNAIMHWYSRSFDEPENNFPKLDISIKNLVNNLDAPDAKNVKELGRYNLIRKINGNSGEVKIISCDFIQNFYFSNSALTELCEKNDIVFILDCPWLSVESYEIKNNGSLKYFCKDIQNEALRNPKQDSLDTHWKSTIKRLDTQFNRITSSDTDKAGDIARVLFDGLLRQIRDLAEKSTEAKEIYIFTSETDGVNYSFLESYPLTRTEMYGGKKFVIAKFTSEKSPTLKCGSDPIQLKIRLWSLLKYIAISYSMDNMKEIINVCFKNYINEPENYIEIMRDIIVMIEFDSTVSDIYISVDFSNRMDKLAKELKIPNDEFTSIKQNLYKEIFSFVKSLYTNVVFADNDNFGDDIMRTGFETNVYSGANDVRIMHFLHYYKKNRKEKKLAQSYNINWKEGYSSVKKVEDSNYEYDFFMDKMLYDFMFDTLELTGDLTMGARATLFSADEIYEEKPYMAKKVLKNIMLSCVSFKCEDSDLYKNAQNALQKLPC